jgi:hypothetical protein
MDTKTENVLDMLNCTFNDTNEPFQPIVYNNVEGDCIEFYVSTNDYYSKRVDDYLTLYLDIDSDDIVGFNIKNIRRIFNKLSQDKSAWAFIIDDGHVELKVLFTMMLLKDNKADEAVIREYKQVTKIAQNCQIDKITPKEFICA